MIKSISFISLVFSSVFLTIHSPNVVADDCSISFNSQDSIRCLQRKINKLENELEQSKRSRIIFPKDAVIDFNAKSCPNGWTKYQAEKNEIVKLKAVDNLVKCQKK